jgi:cytoskeletal protein RodZ
VGELGDLLRRSREQRGLTLEEIQTSTHIKRNFLEALEEERLDDLPHPAVGRGFLANYAAALSLDTYYVLELYDQRTRPPQEQGPTLSEKGILFKNISMSPGARITPDLLIGLFVILILVGVIGGAVAIYGEAVLPTLSQPSGGSPLSTADVAFILPTPTPAPTYTPTATVTPTPLYYTGVSVELVISEESWVQVLVDEVKAFEGILKAGDREHWDGQRQVAVRVGNAGGVEAIVNGESQGVLGQRGQVLDRVYEKVEGTVTVTHTPTATVASQR